MTRHRASIRTMRRWGIRWHTIAKCVLGFHGRPWKLPPEIEGAGFTVCERCGKQLHQDPT